MTPQKILAHIAIGSIFAILLTPFVFYTSLFFPFITAKAYYFRIIVELGFFAWLGLAILDPAYRPKKSLILWALALFMSVMLIANLQGSDPAYSFWSNFERMEGYVTFIHLFAFFIVLTAMMRTERIWNWFLNTAVVVGVLQVGWAALQVGKVLAVGLSADRIDGTLGNATYLAIYMVFTFFIALFLLLKKEHVENKMASYWYIVAMALSTLAVFWTATRGSLLGLIAGVVLTMVLVAFFYPKKKALRYSTFGVVGFALLFVLLVTVFKDSPLVQNVNALRRVASISFTETTTIARFYNWNTAWQGVQQHPLFGYGLGNYGPVFDTYYTPKMWNQEQWFDRVHNVIFDWLIAGGFLGLLSYLSLFIALMYYIWKKGDTFTNAERAVLTGLLAAYCFHNMFVFDNLVSYIYFFMVLGYVHVRVVQPHGHHKKELVQDTTATFALPVAAGLVVLVFPFTAWMVNAPSFQQSVELIRALRIQEINKLPEITSHFQKALTNNTFGNTEIRQQLMSFTSRIVTAQNAALEDKQAIVALAAAEMQKEVIENPNDPKFLVIAGQLLAQTGNIDQANAFFERAVSLSPKKQFLYQPLIEILFKQDKKSEALALARDTYMIEPANDPIWRQYVRSASRAGDKVLYDTLLKQAFETGRADRVIDLVKQNIESDPNSVQPYASLAVAYYQAGDTDNAIATLRLIGEKFGASMPAAKVQADGLIKKIQAGEPLQ